MCAHELEASILQGLLHFRHTVVEVSVSFYFAIAKGAYLLECAVEVIRQRLAQGVELKAQRQF